ncbi:C-C motif chemokine 4-like [Anabas testudineus]|uniref:C-C motif chemokine n=1 Tax=Anabas testudineus TaxID=64144 RepID=A0A3Q1HS30_ANATE|nr:C-C motif chemokine 4-like [Anabas testudineus]
MWNPTELRYTQLRGQADTEAQLRFAPYSSTAKATHALFRMAAPRLALSVFVLMLAAITLSEGLRGAGPKKCCFRFNDNPIPKERVVSYVKTSQRCSNPAILLSTVAGRQLCVKPSAAWVKDLISYMDNKYLKGETSNL